MNTLVAKNAWAFISSAASRLTSSVGEGVDKVLVRLSEQDLGPASILTPQPASLPVLNYLDRCLMEASSFDTAISHAIANLRPSLQWRQSKGYNDELLGKGFLDNYGWCEIIGPRGFFEGDDFLLGLLMLGPHQYYRDHFHPAPELYWPLTSNTEWRKGEEPLTPKAAGTAIWHKPNLNHAMKTGPEPLLTIWSWTKDTKVPARLI